MAETLHGGQEPLGDWTDPDMNSALGPRRRSCGGPAGTGLDNEAFEGDTASRDTHADTRSTKSALQQNNKSQQRKDMLLKQRGIWFTVLSALVIAFSGMTVKQLEGSVSANEISFTRFAIQLIICVPITVFQRPSFKYSRAAYFLLLLRAIVGSANTMIMFYTYQIMPVANAKAIQYCSPVFTGLLGWLLLKEKFSILDAVLGLVMLTGVFLVAQPTFLFGLPEEEDSESSSSVLGALLSLLVAFLHSVTIIILRKLGLYGITPMVMLTLYSSFGMCFTAVVTSATNQWSLPGCGLDRISILLNGICNFLSQVFIFVALKSQRAANVSLIHSSDVMFAFIFEYFLFGTVPNYITIIGTALIVTGFIGITGKTSSPSEKRLPDEKSDKCSVATSESGVSTSNMQM
ncbi:solute carrier family 35 member G1-like [Diadema antillarum]|uniref:solute carrier family 35 member G1-like n=1 Tax=Diadema antillarum TaxID=105358 RepID=UPI003A8A57D0